MEVKQEVRRRIIGTAIPLPGDDIDTDRIIPARYLKCVTFEELGQYAFNDERYGEDGGKKIHPFNGEQYTGGSVLLVNKNFGCGSSREHAPQALMRSGINAIVGESFAEIFSGNCTALGIPAVRVRHEHAAALMAVAKKSPGTQFEIDIEAQTVKAGNCTVPCTMPESDRISLVEGTWDTTSVLLEGVEAIRKTAERIPYIQGFCSNEISNAH